MVSLKDIISVKEVESHISVMGLIRKKPNPLDLLEIEGQVYRVNYMSKKSEDIFEFLAIRIDIEVTKKLTESIFKNESATNIS